MKQIAFTVPINPLSQNNVYRKNPYGYGMYMTKAGKTYKENIAWYAKEEMLAQNYSVLKNPTVNIQLYFSNKRKNDIDGPIKLILDSLNEVVYKDDSEISYLLVEKHYDKKNPRIEIIVQESQKQPKKL